LSKAAVDLVTELLHCVKVHLEYAPFDLVEWNITGLSNKVCNRLLLRRGVLSIQRRIQSFEFDAGISGRKAPSDGGHSGIALTLPRVRLLLQFFDRGHAS
jgi:hypothetical protein